MKDIEIIQRSRMPGWLLLTQPTTHVFISGDPECKLQPGYQTAICAPDSSGAIFLDFLRLHVIRANTSAPTVAIMAMKKTCHLTLRSLRCEPGPQCQVKAWLKAGRSQLRVFRRWKSLHTLSLWSQQAEEFLCTVYLCTGFFMLKWAEYLLVVPNRGFSAF